MIDAEERALMAETVRGALADVLEAARGAERPDVDGTLAQIGWLEMLADEPSDAVDVVFTALGATGAAATALDDVLASALGEAPAPDVAVLLPAFAASDPPGDRDGDRVRARGLATGRVATAGELVVVCGPAESPALARVAVSSARVSQLAGVDPDAGLHAVALEGVAAVATPLDADAWSSALALGRRAVAHQIAGATRRMLELARAHALERTQFGGPISGFQAVRHRLAETLVAVESLEATLEAARDEPNADTAALAKATAGRTAHTVARHCQQVLAGIGFTTEHAFHRFLKRSMVLEGLLGSADEIVLDVGRRLLADRHVPTLIEL